MAVEVSAQDVRDVLGPYGRGWTDMQIATPATMLPARQLLLEMCPRIDELVDAGEVALVRVALASIVAASMIRSSPRFQSSRLGDSSVSFAASSETDRADALIAQAMALVGTVCPASTRPLLIDIFHTVPGRRGA